MSVWCTNQSYTVQLLTVTLEMFLVSKPFHQAMQYCADRNMTMVRFDEATFKEFMKENWSRVRLKCDFHKRRVWIGLQTFDKGATWRWHDNTTASWFNWDEGQRQHSKKTCVALTSTQKYLWIRESCIKHNFIICEKPRKPIVHLMKSSLTPHSTKPLTISAWEEMATSRDIIHASSKQSSHYYSSSSNPQIVKSGELEASTDVLWITAGGRHTDSPLAPPVTSDAKTPKPRKEVGSSELSVRAECETLFLFGSSDGLDLDPERTTRTQSFKVECNDGVLSASNSATRFSLSKPLTVAKTHAKQVASPTKDIFVSNTQKSTSTPSVYLELQIDKRQTSRYRRKFISIPDDRPSAKSMGIVAILTIIMVTVGIMFLDIGNIARDLKTMRSNIRQINSS